MCVSPCPTDEQCDPSLGRCLPIPTGIDCEFRPEGTFDPVVLWEWTGWSVDPSWRLAIATPVVADLDGDGASDIIVPVADFFPGGPGEGGILCALSGPGDCAGAPREIFCTDPSDARVNPVASVAVGDLDGDGELTIVAGAARPGARGNVYGLYGFRPDGTRIPTFGVDGAGAPVDVFVYVGAPAIADLDRDGRSEVFVGFTVFDADGVLLWSRPGAVGNDSFGPMTIAADLDGIGGLEIVSGNMAYHADGTEAWAAGVDARGFSDGYPAIADFDADGSPEVAVVSRGTLRIFNGDGSRFGTGMASFMGRGGPPTIADMNGDGRPDIAVASSNALRVYTVGDGPDYTITELWNAASRDFSSNFTGSSVFDFDGDGQVEVIYADECFARVYDGAGDGAGATTVRFEVPNTSCTGTEYPVVADVTGDGKAEFIVVANDLSGTGSACAPFAQACVSAFPGYVANSGVRVYRDRLDNWVSTRAIWNQHSYHVTNVCDGIDSVCVASENAQGRIPADEPSSWTFPAGAPLNSYRVNAALSGVFSAPDLVPRGLRADLSRCSDVLGLSVAVTNVGAVGVPAGVPVSFHFVRSDGTTLLIGIASTTRSLLPGGSEVVSVIWDPVPSEAQSTEITVRVSVDEDGAGAMVSNECDERNNAAELTLTCSGLR